MIAALGPGVYGDMDSESKLCGKKIKIEGPKGNTITVKVADGCPECSDEHLDLSPAAFAKLGDFDTGILKVKWRFE
ncbi:RlpA-like double-psi beta-barrel-protein domain-containing protein-containing protein [Radiomyces spectabilis]|uniref:RlpA-like double-psi beta-barrel-protein domain-containing protein-containing protein n=1 Tax=Radiomyces spectabilis TaxID=64574 RepID=UPI00221F6E9B|nr:RlpA-like double-psi beta-barrel-protein domain-containing protein-containing protein [Radiomyces spectabilis]KAI8394245.1 RlpA-like double-psi beta-barrel-protein domain-containing protein-containing protein [Radiomyces spectabilis]